jgi:hypothetical protein
MSTDVITPAEVTPTLDQERLTRYLDSLRLEQNFILGLVAGVAAAVVAAAIWAAVTVVTSYQIGWLAIGVGFVVGFAVRQAGKGLSQPFGFLGAALALLGCVIGNVAAGYAFAAQSAGIPLVDVLPFVTLSNIQDLLVQTFNPMDLLFYGLAILAGYRGSFRKITDAELITAAS